VTASRTIAALLCLALPQTLWASATLGGRSRFAPALGGQDLFERAKTNGNTGSAEFESYPGRDRLDLRFGAALPKLSGDKGGARIGFESVIDSDFACGRFDLKANLKTLLSKESRSDMLDALLGALEGELLSNALVLTCEASPTACQAFQHFRVNANAILGLQYDRCQAIQSAVNDSLQGIKAKAIKDCVEERRRGGTSMDEALAACEKVDTMTGLDGKKVKEIDLTKELQKALKIDDVDFAHLQELLSSVRLSTGGVKGEVQADGVIRKFDKLNAEYLAAWTDATSALVSDPTKKPDNEALAKLVPPGASGGILPDELREVAELPEHQRRVVIRLLASESALLHLTLEVQEIERRLAAARKDPRNDESRVRQWTQELEDVRLQLRQIEERAARQERLSAAFLRARDLARRSQSRDAASAMADADEADSIQKRLDEFAPKFGQPSGGGNAKKPGGKR